jgi:hypothetical protein
MATMMTGAETAALTERLAAAHDFTLDDLAANRVGRVTHAQAKRMRRILRRRVRTTWRLVPLCLFLAILIVILYPGRAIWAVVMVLVAIVLAGIAIIRTPSVSQLEAEKVEAVQGAVTTSHRRSEDIEGDTIRHNYYMVEGRRVETNVPRNQDPIALGEWYRVYFMPRYGWLLSLEPAEGPAAGSDEERTLAALTGHWQPEEPAPGMPSNIEIRADGTVVASAGGMPVSARLIVLDAQHIRIVAGPADKVIEWNVEVQGDRLQVKLPLHRHVHFVRVS